MTTLDPLATYQIDDAELNGTVWLAGSVAIFDQYDAPVVDFSLPPANDDAYDNLYPGLN